MHQFQLDVRKSFSNSPLEPRNSPFANVGGVCHARFLQSLNESLFELLLVTDVHRKPIGYCSYWIDVVNSGRYYEMPVLFFQIHYVYVRPENRGQGVAAHLARVFLANLLNRVQRQPEIAAYCDKSVYVSDGGVAFKRLLHSKLNKLNPLPFV